MLAYGKDVTSDTYASAGTAIPHGGTIIYFAYPHRTTTSQVDLTSSRPAGSTATRDRAPPDSPAG